MKVTTRYGTFDNVPEQEQLEQVVNEYWQAYADMLADEQDAIEETESVH